MILGDNQELSLLSDISIPLIKWSLSDCDPDVMQNLSSIVSFPPCRLPLHIIKTTNFSAEWYGNQNAPYVFLYIHGGGYKVGRASMHPRFFEQIHQRLSLKGVDIAILSVEYTLSSVQKFPKPIEEVVSCYEYLLKNMSIAPRRIIVGGDSAGAALSVALFYQIKESYPPPAALVLISPWVDSRNPEKLKDSQKDVITPSFASKAIKQYLGAAPQNHLTSPIIGDLSNFPKTFLIAGANEVFLEQINEFAKKLRESNSEEIVEYVVAENQYHIFPNLYEFNRKAAAKAIQQIVNFIDNRFRIDGDLI